MIARVVNPGRAFLICECAVLFLILPLLIFVQPTPLNVHLGLWFVAAYASGILFCKKDFMWKEEWKGIHWARRDFFLIVARYLVCSVGIVFLTVLMSPQRLFMFPLQKPFFWIVVMILYPLLSALPQELVFRSFFMRRYAPLFGQKSLMLAASAFVFGFIHIVFHNPLAPLLSFVCGWFLATSYHHHKSLKKAAIEHGLYGDMLFTVGLGYYFLVHAPA